MDIIHKIVPCKCKKGRIERVCEKMGLNGYRFRGHFVSRFLFFFKRHYLVFTCRGDSAAALNEDVIRDNAPRGPEYWGDLEQEFKTEQNAAAAKSIKGRGVRIAAIILSLFFILEASVGTLSGAGFFIGQLFMSNGTSFIGVVAFGVMSLFFFTTFIVALCNARGCFSKFNEKTTIARLNRTRRMHIALIVGTIPFAFAGVGIIFVVLNALSLKKVKELKVAAESYWQAKGVSDSEIKGKPLGEYYVKLDKYREYLKYTKAENKK